MYTVLRQDTVRKDNNGNIRYEYYFYFYHKKNDM